MRKWISIILTSVFMFSSILSYADNMGSNIIMDWYHEYKQVFGNITSIAQAIENNDCYVAGDSYSPAFVIETEDYLLQVVEMWSDGNEVFANIELSLKLEYGIIRPYEWSLTNSRYYTPIEQYEVPVFFFFVEIGLAADKVSASSSWGINSLNQTMNRIQRCAIKDELRSEDDNEMVYFRVYIERHENGAITHDTVCFALPRPNSLNVLS